MEPSLNETFDSDLGLLGWPVGAEPQSGNDIFSACTIGREVQSGFCIGYTIGTWEGIKIGSLRMVLPAMEGDTALEVDSFINYMLNVCIPEDVENGQITGVFLKYLENNPSTWHYTARHLLIEALSEAFPCE